MSFARLALSLLISASGLPLVRAASWRADNGNGTYSNPLFYEDFSDPDVIRVGDDYYLAGSSMHAMPGLPVLHSTDLVNWSLASYAFDRLELGDVFRLDAEHDNYGQGIWAPCLRYHDGTYYLLANINHRDTQLFRATNPAGPWTHSEMKRMLHDLSVLFDDDGKVYVVWGYQDLHLAELNADFSDIVPGTERVLFAKDAGMGEGSHFYKIAGRYYILSACWDGPMRMACARADRPEGPYEVKVISIDEGFGLTQGWRLKDVWGRPPLELVPPDPASRGRMSLHQGGIVATPGGEWWGISMMDANANGRWSCLSPITWQDGWPFFGLPGNLTRTPRIWRKPATSHPTAPRALFEPGDDFAGPRLPPVWQWNHRPDDTAWSLAERPGFLRLHTLPSPDFWHARNTLTQHSIGPVATVTTVLDTAGLKAGDIAGLALLQQPDAGIGVRRDAGGAALVQFDRYTGRTAEVPLARSRVWLRVACDFRTEHATFSYSVDGTAFRALGSEVVMVFQLKTFQGVRWSLFAFNRDGVAGGWADFDSFHVDEPYPRGLTRPIPVGREIQVRTADGAMTVGAREGRVVATASAAASASSAATWTVVDRGFGRVALRTAAGFVTVGAAGSAAAVTIRPGEPTEAATFQWIEALNGDLTLMSLATSRYLSIDRATGAVSADAAGPAEPGDDGARLDWKLAD